jgi:hypothetical protein
VHGACDDRFRFIIDRLGARVFEESEDVIYGVWSDFTLAYTNPSWARFAAANGAGELFLEWGLGRSVVEACGPALRPFYERALRRVLETGEAFVHQYACHGPSTRRWYGMRVVPAAGEALVVTNSLLAEVRIADGERDWLPDDAYRAADGWFQQCPHCRRVRAVASASPGRWDFVPLMLQRGRSVNVTHALCPLCFAYHYHQHFTPEELGAAIDELMDDRKRQR